MRARFEIFVFYNRHIQRFVLQQFNKLILFGNKTTQFQTFFGDTSTGLCRDSSDIDFTGIFIRVYKCVACVLESLTLRSADLLNFHKLFLNQADK